MPPQFQNNNVPSANLENHHRDPSILITLIVVMLLSGAGAVWYILNLPPEPAPQPITKVNQLADWKTYNDAQYSFKYPPEWELVTVNSTYTKSPYKFKTPNGEIPFSVTNWSYTGTLEEFFNNHIANFQNSESYWVSGTSSDENIIIDGRFARKAYVDIGNCREINIYSENNGQLYSFVFNEKCIDSKVSKNISQILSTFRFISTSTPLSTSTSTPAQ